MTQVQWRGVFPALTTKFTAADEIDWQAIEQHLEFQLNAGVHGLIILGSLGETSTLNPVEKLEMVRFFAQADRRGVVYRAGELDRPADRFDHAVVRMRAVAGHVQVLKVERNREETVLRLPGLYGTTLAVAGA